MSLAQDIAAFEARLNNAIHATMQAQVADTAKAAMQEALDEKVYGAYEPTYYQRKYKAGGLADPENMETEYDRATMTLTMENVRRDEVTNRLVAPVVESGRGYNYYSLPPRPFHAYTEELMGNGLFEQALEYGLKQAGFTVKKV